MANEQHLTIMKRGTDVWNEWRKQYPKLRPDLEKAFLFNFSFFNGNLRNANLRKACFRGACLMQACLCKADLREAEFHDAELRGADFSKANLSRSSFLCADLSRAILKRAILMGVVLRGANLGGADLRNADLRGADLEDAHLRYADLRGADLRGANLGGADLRNADLRGVDLRGADLSWAILSEANLSKANLTNCAVYAISAWNVQLDATLQSNLIITPEDDESIVRVDNLEVAQFIYLILNHSKLRDVLTAVTDRGVLLLGRFGNGGLEVLQTLAAKLREEKYLPILFDFERPGDRNYTETVKTLAGLSRFVIADLSGPSVPQELYATIPHFKIPFVPIIEVGRKPFAMAVDLLEYPWVVRPPVTFAGTEELLSLIPSRIIAPAEEKHQARQQLLDELFHRE